MNCSNLRYFELKAKYSAHENIFALRDTSLIINIESKNVGELRSHNAQSSGQVIEENETNILNISFGDILLVNTTAFLVPVCATLYIGNFPRWLVASAQGCTHPETFCPTAKSNYSLANTS